MTSENSKSETMMKTETSKNYDYYSKNKKFVESKFGFGVGVLWVKGNSRINHNSAKEHL